MQHESQTVLAEMPFWLLALVSMAGLSGEMLRASSYDMTMGQILKRVGLRFTASGFIGMATLMLAMVLWRDLYVAGALGIITAVVGADVAGGLYTQWLAKRAGLESKVDGQ